jgi:pilus assembly protein Flp/PilA
VLLDLCTQLQGRLFAVRDKMDERGAMAVEYGLCVALIAAVIVTLVASLGTQIQTAFSMVVNAIGGAVGGG